MFAAALLINDVTGEPMESAEAIARRFGTSLEAAEIHYAALVEKKARPQIAERMRQTADDLRRSLHATVSKKQYLLGCCAQCGERSLLPIGIKYLCDSCGHIGDLADGDTVD
jgi:transcription initiation factor IIE alpha subunit